MSTMMNMVNGDEPQMFFYDQANPNHTLTTMLNLYHTHHPSPHQCTSTVVRTMDAPLPLMWSMVRSFDKPEAYKVFVDSCTMRDGDDGGVGSVRDIVLKSELPATTSTERLDFLDDELHVMRFSVIGGDQRLVNYRSTMSMHEEEECGETVVVESYVVDVPRTNTKEETCLFADTIVNFNLKSLAEVAKRGGHAWA